MKMPEGKWIRYGAAGMLALFVVGFIVAGSLWRSRGSSVHDHSGHVSNLSTHEEVEAWTCSMHPQIRLPAPGKCPICGMDLIPARREPGAGPGQPSSLREIRLTPYAERLAAIETHPVERKFVTTRVRMVGKIEYDETRVAFITAWVPGRIDRLFVDFTGTTVRKGDPMVSLYSPELLSTQVELLQAVHAGQGGGQSLVMRETSQSAANAARERLRLWGLPPQQITEILKRGKPLEHVPIPAPMSGVVVRKDALEGMYVQTGSRIYTIADLSHVWVRLDAYESDLVWIQKNQEVEFEAEAYPGEIFKGTVDFIDPFLNPVTRTVRVRLDARNPDGRLKPDMFVHAVLRSTLGDDGKAFVRDGEKAKPPLVIPASAPLLTGRRAVVYVAVPDAPGTYAGREIVLGPRAEDYYLVRHGLNEGELVVTHGNFKIDSAVQILAQPSMMTPEGGGAGAEHRHDSSERAHRPPGTPPMTVPDAFLHQVKTIQAAYEKVSRSVESGDLSGIRKEFASLGKSIRSADPSLLAGHAHLLWMDLVMLLENDAILGSEARSIAEANRAFQALDAHMDRLQREFGLDHPAHPPGRVLPEEPVPRAFKVQMGDALKAYFALHESLAGDRFAEAMENAKTLEKAVRAADMGLLRGKVHDTWMENSSGLIEALRAAGKSEDLENLRRSFLPLSEIMAAVLQDFGIHPEQPVYRMLCPMAFEGKGATWLQKDGEVRNPYYGAAMFRCGQVIRTFHVNSGAAPEVHRHE